ncbi:hypothetical protein JCM30237_26150 [Halolamina litorea]
MFRTISDQDQAGLALFAEGGERVNECPEVFLGGMSSSAHDYGDIGVSTEPRVVGSGILLIIERLVKYGVVDNAAAVSRHTEFAPDVFENISTDTDNPICSAVRLPNKDAENAAFQTRVHFPEDAVVCAYEGGWVANRSSHKSRDTVHVRAHTDTHVSSSVDEVSSERERACKHSIGGEIDNMNVITNLVKKVAFRRYEYKRDIITRVRETIRKIDRYPFKPTNSKRVRVDRNADHVTPPPGGRS